MKRDSEMEIFIKLQRDMSDTKTNTNSTMPAINEITATTKPNTTQTAAATLTLGNNTNNNSSSSQQMTLKNCQKMPVIIAGTKQFNIKQSTAVGTTTANPIATLCAAPEHCNVIATQLNVANMPAQCQVVSGSGSSSVQHFNENLATQRMSESPCNLNQCNNGNSSNNTNNIMHTKQKFSWNRCHMDSILRILLLSIIFIVSNHRQSVMASAVMVGKHEPMFISRSETFKFVAGDTIVLPCEVANTDPYVVAWKRGIAILTAGSVKVTPDPRVRLVNGFNLQIREAAPQDAGDYICQIATMEPREITHTVEILVPPRIHHISTGGHLQVKKGSSVRIECSASGNPTPNVTWSRKNNILPNGEEKLHSHILSIENVDRHKGGVYICTANNGVGEPASSQVVLHVLYPPEISVERPVVFSGEGHEAMLVCIVHGETQPEVIWFKDTMQLDTTERHIMENRGSRHTLIIRKVHVQDFGNYSCVAENQLGKSRKTLELSGKPNVAVFNSPPISQYKDKYNISWSVDSHTPIEEYKLSFRRLPQGHEVDNAIDSQSSSSSSSMLQSYGGLSNGNIFGSTYTHRGVVLNGYGGYGNLNQQWGGRNDWRDVVLPAIPLSHHYTQGMSYMIRGLDPDQHYEATVQARNRYGWSDSTHTFVFSTSSNDGLIDLSTFLNQDLSDNEMRDLSVTFYGNTAANVQIRYTVAMLIAVTIVKLLVG